MTPEQQRAMAMAAARMRMQAQSAPPPQPQDPSMGAGTLQFGPIDTGIEIPQGGNRFLAGLGKAFTDLGRGAEQFVRQAVPGVSPREAALNAEIEASRARDAPLMDTGAGLAGNIVGNVAAAAPAMGIPGVNTYMGSAALGGALSALQPVTEGESRVANAGMGAAGGVAGKALVGGVSRLLSPKTAPAARELLKEGVPLTPGQIMGGAGKRIEEGATSIPVVGDFIRGSQRRAMEGFNKATLNKVLAPIGQKVSKIGREGVEEAQQKLSEAYTKLLPNLKVKIDQDFANDVRQALSVADKLPEATKTQLQSIIKSEVASKFSPGGMMPGETMKQVDSELGRIARGYMKSDVFDSRELGRAVRGVQDALRGVVKRSNPALKKELERIDKGYSMLMRVENAAGRTGAHEGVFSPAQLKAAARQMDSSLRKRGFAQGKANMQDTAEAAQGVLGSTVPDSGTPFRALNMLAVGGGYALDPSIAAGMAAGSAAYSQPVQWAARHLLASRPEVVRQTGNALARLGPVGAATGSALQTNSNRF